MRKLFFFILLLLGKNLKAQTDSLLSVANQQLQLNQTDAAISTLTNLLNQSQDLDEKRNTFKMLSNAWEKKGNNEKAVEFLTEIVKIKDSIHNDDAEALTALKTTFEAEKHIKDIELKQAEIHRQQIIIIALSIVFLLSIVFFVLLYQRKKTLMQTQLQFALLQEKNEAAKKIIEAEEKERKRIAEDLHDGIGQMMSAVKMNLSSLSDKVELINEQDKILLEKTLALADESCKEVRSISHSMMPNALLKTGLSNAVKAFIDKIDHKKINVQLHTEGLEQKLDDSVEIVLYRVIQETVSNVIKHAQANQLDISIIKDEDGIACTIEDNGIGFNPLQSNNGIGLKNIQTRVAYLNGTVEFDSEKNKGTLVAIHVPC